MRASLRPRLQRWTAVAALAILIVWDLVLGDSGCKASLDRIMTTVQH